MSSNCSELATTPTPTSNPDTESANYSVGTFVAVYIDEYRDEIPTIGKIVQEIPDGSDTVEVEWWYGRYSTMWQVCKRKEGREYIAWTEVIAKDAILMPLTLTRSGHLNKQTVLDLKQHYEPYL